MGQLRIQIGYSWEYLAFHLRNDIYMDIATKGTAVYGADVRFIHG
jgi:hypothetical protein